MTHLSAFESLVKKLQLFQHSPNILYEPLSGTNEFGPFGATIKNNIAQKVRQILQREDFWEVEFPIISPRIIWETSGHLKKFKNYTATSDGKTYHLEKLLPEKIDLTEETKESLNRFLQENPIIPEGNKEKLSDVQSQSLLLGTKLGNMPVILRPETATTSYISFKNYHQLFRGKMPIKVFQYGKAFRNEMTGRRSLVRSREFEQLEAQIFMLDENKNETEYMDLEQKVNFVKENNEINNISLQESINNNILKYNQFAYSVNVAIDIMRTLGIPNKSIRLKKPEERFRKENKIVEERKPETWNLEVETEKYGWLDIGEVHERFDLEYHQKVSNKKLSVKNKQNEDEIPSIIEIAFGMGRLMYTILEKAHYQRDGKNILGLPKNIEPVQLAVIPLTNQPELNELARKIQKNMKINNYRTLIETSGSIGKRYARMDELGVPYCITIDQETINDNTLTIRNRDTTEQERIAIDYLTQYINKLF